MGEYKMRFELIDNSKSFITVFKTIKNIVQDIQIKITHKGLKIQAIDTSHIVFLEIFLDIDFFDEYTVQDTEETINLDVEEFYKILNMINKDDRLIIGTELDGGFGVVFEGEAKRVFHIQLLDDELEGVTPPEQNYPTCFEVPLGSLKKELSHAKILSSKACLSVDKDYFKIKADGEFANMQLEYLHGEKVDDTVKSCFNIDKLLDCLSDGFSDVVRLGLGVDAPVNIRLENSDSYMSFTIAPRIEQED
jgi:proliferating cell nuclear antigen